MGLRALVACTQKLLLVDLTTHRVEVVEDHRPEYYGISWPESGGPLCLSHSGLDNCTLIGLEDYVNSETGWISCGPRSSAPFLSQPHQILCVAPYILATNTGRNCISLVRPADLFFMHHRLNEITWDRTSLELAPGNHFNSLLQRDGRLYVLAHNHKRNSQVQALAWPDLTVLERIDTDFAGGHNLWFDPKGRLYTCDSLLGRIVDVRSCAAVFKMEGTCPILRGVAQRANQLWVGGSAMTDRQGRKTADAAIYSIDASRWQLLDRIELPCCGAVHEIRLIDEPDDAHHGIPLCQEIAASPEATARYQELVAAVMEERRQRALCIRGWTPQAGNVQRALDDRVELGEGDTSVATNDALCARDVQVQGCLRLPRDVRGRHVGLVARYRGPADQNMVVGLIYRDAGLLRADLWRHAGTDWCMLACTRLPVDAEQFNLTLIAQGDELQLLIDNQVLLRTCDSQTAQEGLTGVRGTAGRVEGWSARAVTSAGPPSPPA